MRLRLVALLGCLAMLAILGAPTLTMSLREHLPTAPWQTSTATPRNTISGERGYLTAMLSLHEQTLAAARRLARSPRADVRHLAAQVVADQTVWVARTEHWLHDWYSVSQTPDPPAPDRAAVDRPLLRALLVHEAATMALCGELLADGLAVHPAVARLAVQIRATEHAEMSRVRQLLLSSRARLA